MGSICDVSQGFLTALPRRPSMLCLLRSVSASLRRVAEPRPEVTARRCDTPPIPDGTAGLRCATMPPAGPTKAAPMQSSADEKAQISEVTPARSRMHKVSALPPARAFAREGDGHRPSPCLTHLLMTKTTAPATGRGAQALPSGTATNLVASPMRTRIRTVCLPLVFASLSALRTSPTLATGLPPTSRITLPR